MRESGRAHCALRSVSLIVQQLGGGLEFLVLEQPPDQRIARIFLVVGIAGGGLGPRQQHPALDVDQRRRHHQELAGDVEVELLHQVEVLEVLLGDQRDRDVVDVHLVLLDQMNEQIERALERLHLDLDVVELRLETPRSAGAAMRVRCRPFEHFRLGHGVAHALHRRRAQLLAPCFEPFDQHVANIAGSRQRRCRRSTDRIEHGVDGGGQLGLDLDVADLACAVARLEIVDLVRDWG